MLADKKEVLDSSQWLRAHLAYMGTQVQFSVVHRGKLHEEVIDLRSQAWSGWRRALSEKLTEAIGQNRVLTGLAVVNLLGSAGLWYWKCGCPPHPPYIWSLLH